MGKTHRNHRNAKGPTPQLRSRNTRSSKGRLLTETTSSTTLLTTQLSLLGLYAAPTIGDGNCLFRALSDQLYGSPSKHHELRQQICDHITKYKSCYEPFVEDERGLDAHLRAMRENATYGGHMELSAFAHMTRRNVKVIQPGLVYVIEWDAAGRDDGGSSASAGSGAGRDESSTTPRRTSRRSTSSVSPTNSKEAKEEARIKLGRGYYVYEEVLSDEEGDTAKVEVENARECGPTVYVAYHDWEHFSSIRNLRGPHTGLPDVAETPPPSMEDPEQLMTAKEKEKERDRERRKERERKEKERKDKERERKGKEKKEKEKEDADMSSGTLKVKLKLPSAHLPAGLPPVSLDASAVPSSTSCSTPAACTTESQPLYDPSSIPLPASRSASPFIGSSSSLVASSAASPMPSSSLANEVYPEDPSPDAHISTPERLGHGYRHPHAHVLQTPRSQYRSPKRTFDESSASGGEDDPDNSKRSRRRVGSAGWSGAHADGTTDTSVGKAVEGDVVKEETIQVDGTADTPAISVPSSSSSPLSSVAHSVASSEVDVDDAIELQSQADEPDNDSTIELSSSTMLSAPLIMPDGLGKNARQKYLHMHTHHGHHAGGKPLTRRQRKAFGLAKPRKGVVSNSLSAGKIVIPGGKWKGNGDAPEQAGNEEWKINGTGRLDVRGFRELKI